MCWLVLGCLASGWAQHVEAQGTATVQRQSGTHAMGPHPRDAPVPDDEGQTNVKGAPVRSVLPHGGKHFVSPKKAGDNVTLIAQLPHDLDAQFDKYFEWVKPKDPDTGADVGTADGSKFNVPRDKPGKYTVEVRTKTTGTVATVDKITVWIVWVTGSLNAVPAKDFSTKSDTTISGTPTISAKLTSKTDWQFVFTIAPSEIVDKTKDIPDLQGANNPTPKVPGAGTISPSPAGSDLAGGVDHKWDMSRRYAFFISNPTAIPRGKFTADFGKVYDADVPSGFVVPLPDDSLIGNDDFGDTSPENDDPYNPCSDAHLVHAVGQMSSYDQPTLYMPDAGGTPNATFEQSLLAQEFARLQIGGRWYLVSDPVLWKVVEKLTFSNGHWQDNGLTLALGN